MNITAKSLNYRKSQPELFRAKIVMPSREMAKALGVAWTRKTLVGHSVGPSMEGDQAIVTIYDILPEDKPWLEATANEIATHAKH